MGKVINSADCFKIRSRLQFFIAHMLDKDKAYTSSAGDIQKIEEHLDVCGACNNYSIGLLEREGTIKISSGLVDKVVRLPKR